MYDNIENLLEDWGFSHLVVVFKEHQINMENFFLLDDSTIKESIPLVGKRITFLSFFNKAKLLTKCDVIETTQEEEEREETENLNQANLEFEQENTDKENNEQFFLVPQVNRQMSAVGLDLFKKESMPDFDLRTLLSTSAFGTEILTYYAKNDFLDMKRRNKLTDIIIKHIFNYVAKHRLTAEQYNILTSKIVGLFPRESASIYYVAAIKKNNSSTGKPILARGKLVDKCRNLLHECGPSVVMRKRGAGSCNEGNDCNDENKRLKLSLTDDENIKNDILWLKNRSEPLAEVILKWTNTYKLRKLSSFQTVKEFYDEWPILKKEHAATLINLDFEKEYPQSTLKLSEKWDKSFEQIFEYKKPICKDKNLEELLAVLNSDISEDTKFATQPSLLPYLIPPKGKINVGNKKLWKFSTAETLNSIICHAKLPGDIEKLIKDNKATALLRKQTVQPYVIFEGLSLYDIKNVYLVIDELTYQFSSVKEAFDICFKLHITGSIKYAPQAEHIYLVVQKGIYDINTNLDPVIPYVMDILELLKD